MKWVLKNRSLVAAFAGLLLAAVASGCHGVRAYPVDVTIDSRIQDQSVQVDIVGVSEADYQAWHNYSMTQYWRFDDAWRRDAEKYVMRFGQDTPAKQTLPVDDPMWDTWLKRGATRLLILGDLPEVLEDRPGAADPRRLVLPLNSGAWAKPRPGDKTPIEIRIESGVLRCLTPFDPSKF